MVLGAARLEATDAASFHAFHEPAHALAILPGKWPRIADSFRTEGRETRLTREIVDIYHHLARRKEFGRARSRLVGRRYSRGAVHAASA